MITDENGDLDEDKCLALLFIPQSVNVQINNNNNSNNNKLGSK